MGCEVFKIHGTRWGATARRYSLPEINWQAHILDITYAVHKLSQIMSRQYTLHPQAVHHLIQSLKGSTSQGLLFSSTPSLKLTTFTDADWGRCLTTHKSTTGLHGLSILAIALARNPTSHEISKHVDIDVHLIREHVASGFQLVNHPTFHIQCFDAASATVLILSKI
ncbi:copia protein, partial [Trifolium medium]|nr:copia protein [Trifolium medium]